ncbi:MULTISPECIES: hypothetical protein [unclassified Lysinibacillus]|uniref:hypothetical protein n=1 Tax=unclassified Lysinibacillus TaxID=2636778 RepID=UPI0035DFFDD5
MSDYFRIKKSLPSDEPIKYTINRDYLNKSIEEYEKNLKEYDAKIEKEKMTVDEIFALDSEQLESMTIEELTACVSTLHSASAIRKMPVGKDGAILLDRNNPADREWYENDKDYDIL